MSEGLSVCKALAALFKESDEVNESAVNFVAMTAMQVRLTEEQNAEVMNILKDGGDFKALLGEINSKPMRGLFLRRMLSAVLLDEEITEKEQALIDSTLKAFGVAANLGAELVAWTRIGIDTEKRLVALLDKI
jgi:hypothetical protein